VKVRSQLSAYSAPNCERASGWGALRRAVAATRGRRGRRGLLWLSVALGAGAVLAAVGLLTTSGYLISRAAQRPEILALGVAIVGVRFFGICRALLRYGERLASHDLAFRTLTELRRRFFERLVPLVPGGVADLRRSDLLSRFVGDVDRLQDLYLRALGPPLVAALAGLASVAIAALILPAAGLALAAMLLLGGVLAPALTRRAARAAGRRQAGARAELSTGLVEVAAGAAEIAVAGREADWIERSERSGARLAGLQRRDALSGGLAVGLGTALATGAAVLLVAVATPAVHSGALAGVLLAALALLALGAFEAVAPLGAAAASVDACASAALRIESVLDRTAPVAEPTAPRPLADWSIDHPIAGSIDQSALQLELRDVGFRYGENEPWVLHGASLRLRPGRAVALLGPSGTGKSTVAELAVRFRDPTEGSVLIGGVDLREAAGEEARAAVRLSPQDAYLFTTTLRDNVAIGRAGAGDEEVAAALESVGLGGWLASLPEGLDTEVGEAGARVSGGQRQRIAAARSFLAKARFLIFDEPTAHLDPEGGAALQRRLAGLAARGAGVLVITHEAHDLGGFDELLALEGGRFVPAAAPAG
jgi:thiol reductant ABC exporter CydC subunit